MSFQELFNIEPNPPRNRPRNKADKTEPVARSSKPKKEPKSQERGCAVCPLNEIEGIQKIMGTTEPDKKLLVLAQSPGPEENQVGKELIGRSGKFFWSELRKVGISRNDCNIQNSVRCFPADVDKGSYSSSLKMRSPTNEEIRCCSIHTEKALDTISPSHILVLGQVAAKALLKARSLPQQKVFYSEALKAKIYLVDHPAFFIRAGVTTDSEDAANPKLGTFRKTLALLASDIEGGEISTDPYAYLRQQKYYLITNERQAIKAKEALERFGYAGRRIGTDIENYDVDGKIVVTACGFSPKPGLAFVFMFEHQDLAEEDLAPVKRIAKEILENPRIFKAMQWGCSDYLKLREIGIHVEGYDHDTLTAGYFANPDGKKYGLEEQAELKLPEFSGYKNIIYPDMLAHSSDVPQSVLEGSTAVQKAYIKKHHLFDIRKLSLETYRLYNGADADVTKRLEIIDRNSGPQALMRLYIRLSLILYQMEANGPLFDYEQNDKLAIIYPAREKKLLAELREMIGDENYNPASPKQVTEAIYGKLGLVYPGEGKPNTQKNTLTVLGQQHPFPLKQVEVRKTQKALGTYVEGFRRCADANKGKLRTHWKYSGTATGRNSSGGDKNDPGCVNLQNVPNDPFMRNMLIADTRWREAYEAWLKLIEVRRYMHALKKADLYPDSVIKALAKKAAKAIMNWIAEFMPDLKTFLGFDEGQIEVRVAAQLCGDKNLIKDCMESDIHSKVGATITGWSVERIRNEKKIRTLTKNCIAEGQRVLTDKGLIPIQSVTKKMRVWDGLEWVKHDGLIYQGTREVIEYDGLEATPDHEVYIQNRYSTRFLGAKNGKCPLAIGAIGEETYWYDYEKTCHNPRPKKPSYELGNVESKMKKVYDLLNAGPRHRFTVEGKIVSNCHFGILYAQSEDGLVNYIRAVTPAEDMKNISEDFIREGYRRYHKRYSGVRKFHETQRSIAREFKYVETLFGLRRPLQITEGNSKQDEEEEFADNETGERSSYWANICVNSRIQGTAHQLMNCAIVNLWTQPEKYKLLGIPTMEVHDYLGFMIKVTDLPEAYKLCKYLMETEVLETVKKEFPDIKWHVPLVVEGECGPTLGCQVPLSDGFDVGEVMLEWLLKRKKQEDQLNAELEACSEKVV